VNTTYNLPNPQDIGMANCNINTCDSQDPNMSTPQELEFSSILYGKNLLMNPNLWDESALLISILV